MNTILLIATIYGSLVSTNQFVKAPYAVKIGEWTKVTETITETEANSVGYKMMLDEPPVCDTNHYALAVGWREDNRIHRVYEIKPVPPPPARRFYKYDMSAACLEFEFLDQYMAFINSNEKIKWFYNDAEILVETDPYFIAGTNLAVQSGVITNEKVKKILDRAYELGQSTEVSK